MTVICLRCRKEFFAAHRGTLCCSDGCRKAHLRRYQVIDLDRRSPTLMRHFTDARLYRPQEDNDGRPAG